MAETDPYKILGVDRKADATALRDAYRKLAKKYHPDLNPGDKAAEERFKSISGAYDLLSDEEKRGKFDRGEIDAAGNERAERQYWRQQAEGAQGPRYRSRRAGPAAEDADFADIFSDFFNAQGGAGGRTMKMRGRDEMYTLPVAFLDAVTGATQRLMLPDGRTLDVRIPAGTEDGQSLRLRGQGGPGINGGETGDALIEVKVQPHGFFRRDGDNIELELPITLREAVLGGRIEVPTPGGAVAMTIPANSDSGRKLRLRGKGVPAHAGKPAGDLHVTLRIVLGAVDAAMAEFLRAHPAAEADPRAAMLAETKR